MSAVQEPIELPLPQGAPAQGPAAAQPPQAVDFSGRFLYVDGEGRLHVFGIRLVGANEENLDKLLLTIALFVVVLLLAWLARRLVNSFGAVHRSTFWARQGIRIVTSIVLVIGVLSIWFDDPTRLATALGLVTAGLAFALQRVVTALAGYVVILRGKTFNVGDRITMGGVRGDVIALSFIQTTIMEMGQPPRVQGDEPAMWVQSRQYTGRIVTVSNGRIFEEPVYNYTREFPYLWEEMTLPIPYAADRAVAERTLLAAAERHTLSTADLSEEALREMRRRYFMQEAEMKPRVYWRLTDNWLEMTVRFIADVRGIRELKDRMSRDIVHELEAVGIGLASATFQIVGLPPVRVERDGA